MNAEPTSPKQHPVPGTEREIANPVLPSHEILKGSNEVRISHSGCVYSLRVTRQGKLILTK